MKARKFALTLRVDELETITAILKALGLEFAGRLTRENITLAIRGSNPEGALEESPFAGGANALLRNLVEASGEGDTKEESVLKMREALKSPVPES